MSTWMSTAERARAAAWIVGTAILATILAGGLAPRAGAQTSPADGGAGSIPQLIDTWHEKNGFCRDLPARDPSAPAVCDARRLAAEQLAARGYCYGAPPASNGLPTWQPCPTKPPPGPGAATSGPGAADPAAAAGPQLAPRTAVPLRRRGGTFVLTVTLNDSLRRLGILDSGASYVSVPEDVVTSLQESGTVVASDFLGQRKFRLADGRTVEQRVFRLKSLALGDQLVQNVLATVAPAGSPLLVGQTVLRRFRSWAIDNKGPALLLD